MINKNIIKTTFAVSLLGHCIVLGVPGIDLNKYVPKEEEISVTIDLAKIPLLPDVKTLAKEKKLDQSKSEDITPEKAKEIPRETRLKEENVTKIVEIVEKKIEKVDTPSSEGENLFRYRDTVNRRIQEARRYPQKARIKGIEGIAVIRFIVTADGTAENIELVSSSDSKLLDREAIDTVKRASPFPRIPENMGKSRILMDSTLIFQLYPDKDQI